MDPLALASTAVAMLAPYLAKAADKFAGAAGDAAWKAAGELYDALKARLSSHPVAVAALGEMAKTPDHADSRAMFELALKKAITDDPQLLAALAPLLQPMENAATAFNTTITGNVDTLTQIGQATTVNIGTPKQ